MNIILQGEWRTGTVYLDGGQVQVDDQVNGFVWGTTGIQTLLLAHAILCRMLTPTWATRHCEAFCKDVISVLPQTDFKMTVDLGRWLDRQERKRHSKRRSR